MQLMDYKIAGAAKRLTPMISRAVAGGPRRQRLVHLVEVYLGILQGKGAASAWSREGEARAVASAIAAERPVIVDVGAAIGDWSEQTSKQLGRPGRFVLVEPSEVNWPRLADLNVEGEVSLVTAACGAARGRAQLKAVFAGAGSGSIIDRRDSFLGEMESVQDVEVTTVAQIAEDHGLDVIDFLKVDVEGAELDVFRGAAPLLEAGRIKALSFEFGSGQVNARSFFRDFWDLLTGYDFEISCITPAGQLIPLAAYDESYEYFRGVSNFLGRLRV